ncbi:MAG: TolB family protein, partial [Planctomycetota bacterium]
MKKHRFYISAFAAILLFSVLFFYHLLPARTPVIDQYVSVDKTPHIRPDYTDTVIPPNIAPLNFLIKEPAAQYLIKIYSTTGDSIDVFSKTPGVIIPIRPWKKLLTANRGGNLYFDVYTKNKTGQWVRFKTITNTIANENIDPYLVYRKIRSVHSSWKGMGIYQRNLQNFDESLVLNNRFHEGVCLNCHAFANNRADKMAVGFRSSKYGSSALLVEDGTAKKLGTKFTYTAWHPSGRLVAYSYNNVRQFFHTARREIREVVDLDSLLAYYLTDSQTIKTSPNISKKDRLETYPTWSPDGRYLYFCSAPILWSDRHKVPPQHYDEVRYDLQRIIYDLEKDQWGDLETVLSAEDTGLSILEPRISPDGRWLLCCMSDYGSFPVYYQSSDLYLIDLKSAEQTGRFNYRRLDINSDKSESWHSWSSNSRWIVFSSKRDYGLFTRS